MELYRRKFVSPLRISDGDYLIEIADVSEKPDEKKYAIAIWAFRVYGDGFKSIKEALNNALATVEKLRFQEELNFGTSD